MHQVMHNVSGPMRRRGLVVAALGVLLGMSTQASLTDDSRCRLRVPLAADAKPDAVRSNLEPACHATAGRPGPRGAAPVFSRVVEIARFDVRAVPR